MPPQPQTQVEDIHHPMWLSVTQQGEYLCVYRSVLVPDNDPRLEPVNRVLNNNPHRIITALTGDDPDMMFGEALITVYRIGVQVDQAAS